ncbi:glycosyltransferase [Blastococcus sp. CT_GayMR20]|uniref:glycosyltransferase n=1 Tax=Blastococcus sp. CT_GayMR20 TaxID=2559609 RepID=UPI001073865D|nr:nucleotide disphospho-sugar-binding domain-containing protein [Blastococcus sp. CT_GayMR20]TFV92045.1 glycosyltransferase [Blastococcus sp. CT_GayMR20]
MRALFVASPMVGHVQPLLPLAIALRDAGHDVVLATGPEGLAAGRSSGLDVRDVAPGLRVMPVFMGQALAHPLQARRAAAGEEREPSFVGVLFSALGARMADGVVRLADEWRPDIVVQEALAAVGALAAVRRGVPLVVVNMTFFDAERLFAVTAARLGGVARRHGLVHLPEPAEVLGTAPPSLVGSRRGRPMRFVPVPGDGAAPADLTRPGARPRIIVSRSTVADPRPDRLMSRVVEAAAGMDVEIVLARPDKHVSRGPLPANVRTTEWLPFPAVFPAAAATVHHGGAGTILTALAAGIPQLVTPGAGDRAVNAELVAARGVGLAIPTEQITPADLRRLVGDPALKQASRDVADEIAGMPAPAELVEPLAALAR